MIEFSRFHRLCFRRLVSQRQFSLRNMFGSLSVRLSPRLCKWDGIKGQWGGRETINESFCIESDGDVKESGCCVGSIVKLISAIYWANLPDGNVVEVFPICRSTAPVSPPARPTVANIGSVA